MYQFNFSEAAAIIAIVVAISAIVGGILKFIINDIYDFKNSNRRKEESKNSLNSIISALSSADRTSQLSAAIMLRRFMNTKISNEFPHLQTEAINVIASMLKFLPTGVFQKTLADGLAYAVNLSGTDLQRTNLQDAYLGRKDSIRLLMDDADLYLSDLSYALLENIEGNAVFYRSILFCTQIKHCNFSRAVFREADLSNATFRNVVLKDADFTGAINIPKEIEKHLIQDNDRMIFPLSEAITAKHPKQSKSIFFSMPSVMDKGNELLTKDFKTFLERLGYHVHYYVKDDYPCYGQLNRIREKICTSSAMVVFGFKQANIHKATYRPGTKDETEWNDRWIATPWNEIEVGMGLMKGMPILLVKDRQIDMGIFDNNLSECFIASISTSDDSRKLSQNKEINKWLSKITL